MQERPLGLMIWLRMARFVQRSNCISNDYLSQAGLTVAQFEALSHIQAYQPVTQTDLAGGLTISVGGVSRMLSRLEGAGLIERTPDWKIKYISLTETGQQLLRSVYPGQVALQASMFDDVLTSEEQKQLYALMRKVHRNSLTRQAPIGLDPAEAATPGATNETTEMK